MLGKILSYNVNENKINLIFETGQASVVVINSKVLNFFTPNFKKEKNSKAIEGIKYEQCYFQVEKQNHILLIKTEELEVKIYDEFKVDIYDKNYKLICEDYRGEREPFIRKGGNGIATEEGHKMAVDSQYKVLVAKTMEKDMYFYGFGEKTGHLNKRGYHYKNWNTDNPNPHGETFEQLYKTVPFFITLKEKEAFGIFFDNTFETHFDMGKENSKYFYFASVDGNLDYYFIYGPDIKEVVTNYSMLTGTTPLPQLWSLGYQQSRFSYSPDHMVLEVAKNFREKDIPCDVLYLDIDYMDGFRVFTWDGKKFSNPKKMIEDLNKLGFKVVTIIDPGVKKDSGYKIYDEGIENRYFVTDRDGIVYVNRVWPGDSVYPDFTNSKVRKWWASNHKILTDVGVAGIWNDMNEPASFNGELPSDVMFNEDGVQVQHKEVHNVYGHLMCKATFEGLKKNTNKRPFVLTRACYSGTQKYSAIWTGDNQSTWEHLRMAVPMLLNLGLSGLPFAGTDVGGFGFDSTGELLSRWVQLGTFCPFFRNHTVDFTRDQEPWAFDKVTEEINRKYIKLRYRLIPYLYDLMKESEDTGAPVMRPLVYHYQCDENVYQMNEQFLFGENMLVAPVLEQGAKARMVYLPKGTWIDFWTGEENEGGKYIIKETPLDICPIFIKSGAIIPNYVEQRYIGEKIIDTLKLNIYLGSDNRKSIYRHYQDDGESYEYRNGKYNDYEITVENGDCIYVNIEAKKKGFHLGYKNIELIIKNYVEKDLVVNGKSVIYKEIENMIYTKINID